MFKAKWLFSDSFFKFVESHAHQLIRKTQLREQTIKVEQKQIKNLDKELNILKQHLEELQLKQDPQSLSWMQEKNFKNKLNKKPLSKKYIGLGRHRRTGSCLEIKIVNIFKL